MIFLSALSQSVSSFSTHSFPLSSALSPSRCLSPLLIPFHSLVRSLPVGVSHPHSSHSIKCALSQSVSSFSTHSLPLSSALSPSRRLPLPHHLPYQVRSLPVGVSPLYSFLSTLKCALSQLVSSVPTQSHPIKCALSQSASLPSTHSLPLSSGPSPSRRLQSPHLSPYQVRSLPVGISFLHSFPSTLK